MSPVHRLLHINLDTTAHIVEMAHDLGIGVVLEGVETESDLALARSLDVELAQGFYLHAPDSHPRDLGQASGYVSMPR